jgi:hypothetical protein
MDGVALDGNNKPSKQFIDRLSLAGPALVKVTFPSRVLEG